MDRKELKRLAKEVKVEAGIYQIRNTGSGKVLVMATRNLRTVNGQRFALETGGHGNRELQHDWNTLGPAAFAVEVLEVLDKPETGYFDERGELKKLKQKWLEQLKPYGEHGYNRPTEEDEE